MIGFYQNERFEVKQRFKLFHDLKGVDLLDIFPFQGIWKYLLSIEMFQFQHTGNRI